MNQGTNEDELVVDAFQFMDRCVFYGLAPIKQLYSILYKLFLMLVRHAASHPARH